MRAKGEIDVFDSPFATRKKIKTIPAGNQVTVTGKPYGANEMAMIADGPGVAYVLRQDLIPPLVTKTARINVVDGQTAKVPCPDQAGQTLLASEPTHGDVSREEGQRTYRPRPGYSGRDSFSCLYMLGNIQVAEIAVSVSVAAPPPPPPPPPAQTVAATPVLAPVLAPLPAPPPKTCDANSSPPPRDLSNCQLTGKIFRAPCDFRGVNFSGANLAYTRFLDCDLRDSNFSKSNLEDTSFSGSDLTSANLAGANVRNVNWASSTVNKANLRGAANLDLNALKLAYGYRDVEWDRPEPDAIVKGVTTGVDHVWKWLNGKP